MGRLTYLLALCALLFSRGFAAGQCSPCTIWSPSSTPAQVDSGDNSSVEVGVKFRSDVAGYVSGVRFYKSINNVGVHIGNLWNSSGVLLASAQFSGETGSGWQQISFSTPVLISANTTYIVSYFAPQGRYSFDVGYFSSVGVDNAPLHALANGVDGSDGVYNYGSSSAFPSSSYNATNYWVDVVFVPQGSTVAPTVTSTSPAAASGGFVVTSSLTAGFSTVMNSATITPSSFQLFDPNNNAISGNVTYSTGTNTATFQPGIILAYQTTYTAIVQGTVSDFLGNSMGTPFSWSFTTGNGPSNATCPCTIWPSNSVPSLADSGDGSSIEAGVKFKVDVNGFITGIRFYKSLANTGTHIGNLWTTGGNLLGTVTFSGETASGWQQANFATPILVTPGNTYIASYFAPNGHYSWDEFYLTNSVDNVPLHALSSSSSGGNGIYVLTAQSTFPSTSYDASNYGVDISYLMQNSTTPPVIVSTTPGSGTTGAPLGGAISVQFSEPMDPTTITSNAFQLVDSSNNVIPGTVTYASSSASLLFQSSLTLTPQTPYTATVQGFVHDALGNTLGNNYSWTFTSAPPPADSGPGGPILVIASSVNPFSRYIGEILLNEGLNEFLVKDITTVTPTVLSNYDIVILGDFPLTGAQASMISTWVSNGGSLIALHPDQQLAGILGLTPLGETLSDQYMLVNTQTAPGAGIYGQTMQFHGTADLYTLNGATSLATLYANQSTPTSSPALTLAQSGVGQAAAFTYDLARSVVYTRQGNPAWSGQARNPYVDPSTNILEIRAADLFYGDASFDPEPDWVNLNNVQVPQADEQQRLFTNLIQLMNVSRKPLPRFWYFPDGYKGAVVMSGDDHGGNGTQPRFDIYVSQSPANCSVADWTCVRATSYVFPANVTFNPPTSYTNYIAEGFEVANHSDNLPTCSTYTPASLQTSIVASQGRMSQYFPQAPPSKTNRTHCVLWSDYDSQPSVLLSFGIRFDTSYYYWPDSWVQDQPGLFTGSGLPMRYSDRNGNTIDVYQAPTQFPDETTWTYPNDIDTVLANVTGPNGFYAVITANMHTDNPQEDGSDIIVTEAQSYGIPVVASLQMLTWLDGRNNSTFGSMSWSGNTLNFTVAAATGSHGLGVMVPATSALGPLHGITLNGAPVSYVLQTIKGLQYGFFLTAGGTYQASYGSTYSIGGTIGGAGGSGATVTLSGPNILTRTTTADASGNYAFAGLNSDSYTITPSEACCTYSPASQNVTVNLNNVAGVNFNTAVATYTISGAISGVGGNGATVTLSGSRTATTTASSTGTYTFSGLANGAYTVTPSRTGYAFTPTSQSASVNNANLTGINFSSAVATYSISGTISGAGGNGATLTLSGAGTATTTASSTGTYTFTGLTKGAYTVTPSNTGYSFTPASLAATVNNANVTGVNFATATHSISGTISGAGGNGATVALSGAGTATVSASSAGNYTFTGLANGTYTVTPKKSGYAFTPSSQTATVAGANVTGLNFSSVAGAYTISGTITGAGGIGATVTLSGAGTETTTADGSGNYTISGVANGTYTVTPTNPGFTFTPVNRSKTVSGANITGVNFSAPGAPAAQLSPATWNFGSETVGVAGSAQPITLSNTGTAAMTISSITLTGTNPTNFAQTNNCGTSLATGTSCTINVTFTPSSTGAKSAKVSVADNAPNSPQTVALSGTGATAPAAQLSSSGFNFGTIVDFAVSAPQSVTLKNSGTTALQIDSIAIGGTNPGDFVISSNACGASLAAASTCIVKVEFTPQAEGARTATLTFTDSAASGSQSVSLSGTGTLAKVSPVTLTFTALKVGSTSAAKTVTIKNVGPDILSFSSITLTGANPGDFTDTTTCGSSLAVNASCTVAVRFVPTATGSRTATLSISDSDPTSPQLVTLSGTGQ